MWPFSKISLSDKLGRLLADDCLDYLENDLLLFKPSPTPIASINTFSKLELTELEFKVKLELAVLAVVAYRIILLRDNRQKAHVISSFDTSVLDGFNNEIRNIFKFMLDTRGQQYVYLYQKYPPDNPVANETWGYMLPKWFTMFCRDQNADPRNNGGVVILGDPVRASC